MVLYGIQGTGAGSIGPLKESFVLVIAGGNELYIGNPFKVIQKSSVHDPFDDVILCSSIWSLAIFKNNINNYVFLLKFPNHVQFL